MSEVHLRFWIVFAGMPQKVESMIVAFVMVLVLVED
jgi:hypothetical protein